MTEQLLHRANVVPILEQVGRETVPHPGLCRVIAEGLDRDHVIVWLRNNAGSKYAA